MEKENQISIIIDGTRYDAVERFPFSCYDCDLQDLCPDIVFNCIEIIGEKGVFKKSNKKFEV